MKGFYSYLIQINNQSAKSAKAAKAATGSASEHRTLASFETGIRVLFLMD